MSWSSVQLLPATRRGTTALLDATAFMVTNSERTAAHSRRCARAHGPNVGGPKVAELHSCNGREAGMDGVADLVAEKTDEWHDHESRKHAAGEDDACNARSDTEFMRLLLPRK